MGETIAAICRELMAESDAVIKYTDDIELVGEGSAADVFDANRLDELEHIQKLTIELTKALAGDNSDEDDFESGDNEGDDDGWNDDADWEESKHPRASNGQFGSGGGSSTAAKSGSKSNNSPQMQYIYKGSQKHTETSRTGPNVKNKFTKEWRQENHKIISGISEKYNLWEGDTGTLEGYNKSNVVKAAKEMNKYFPGTAARESGDGDSWVVVYD